MSKQLVIDTLKNNHTQRIGFTYTGETGFVFRLSAGDFSTVALNIEQGNIDVREGGVGVGKARYTIRNDGPRRANTFYLGRNNAALPVYESLLVHESVHAIFDLKGISMPWIDNEVLAYIAQGFYLLSAGVNGGLAQEAFCGLEIARAFHNIGRDSFWLDALKEALRTNPTYLGYIGGTFEGDG